MASELPARLLVVAIALVAIPVTALPASADPPDQPDHGVPPETFYTLWSRDADTGEPVGSGQTMGTSMRALSSWTDIPLDEPPSAVETWNRRDHEDFPPTNRFVAIHPPGAARKNGRFVRDASVAIFAIDPSTRARLSPSRQPLYVAPRGTLRGTADYRVVVPENDTIGDRHVNWTLESSEINRTSVLVDDRTVAKSGGSHTPTLSYRLRGPAGESHTLALRARFTATLLKQTKTCTNRSAAGDCTDWERSEEYVTETVAVTDRTRVVEYDLAVSGFVARYPDGDIGLVVYRNQPWLSYTLPNGDVRGVWRFYSARDPQWDTLVYSRSGDSTVRDSPLHPLRTVAYPIETGPTPTPRGAITILDVSGTPRESPTLPENVHLDAARGSYTASYGIATRARTTADLSCVHVHGLVRGVDARRTPSAFARMEINRSRLTLTVLNETATSVTVRVELHDAQSGAPIDTSGREGYLVIEGKRVNTSRRGTVVTTVERPTNGVTARYEPGRWWREDTGYTETSSTIRLDGPALRPFDVLYRLGIVVSLSLVAVRFVDRFTLLDLWPPWRDL